MAKSLRERFDEKWIPEPNTGCWLWLGAGGWESYGHMRVGGRDGSVVQATHVSLLVYRGLKVGPSEEACHSCDTPGCVNPWHLFTGTRSDNLQDMARKRRHWKHVAAAAILAAVSACSGPQQPPLPVTNDPLNCDTYKRHRWGLKATVAQAQEDPSVIDDHNTNEANAAACSLGNRKNSLGPR